MSESDNAKTALNWTYFKPYGRIAAIFFIGFTVFLIVSTFMLFSLTRSASEVKVPEVTGKRFLDIYNQLERAGLRPRLKFRDAFDMNDGFILKQSPAAGSVVRENSTLKLTVSRSSILIDVPNLVGKDLPIALNKIRNLHSQGRAVSLPRGMITYIPSDKSADNIVIDQEPKPGERVTPDRKVNLLISTGNVALDNKMPDVTGQSIDLCFTHLVAKGLVVQQEIVESLDLAKSGIIASQTPAAGTPVKKGDVATIAVNWYRLTEPPYAAYEKVDYTIQDGKGAGLYEAYVEDYKSKRIVFSRQMREGEHIVFVFHRDGDAKVTILCNKKQIRILGFDSE